MLLVVRVDLHGLRHEDVQNEVIRFVEKYWDTGLQQEIITGHSEKMKNLVIEILEEYKLNYVTGCNIGYIRILD